MNLTTKGRYAVMAMADLAINSKGSPVVLADIAARQEIAVSYLEQIFMKLRRAGVVSSVRGPGGGYVVSRPVDEVSIAEIIAAVDESIKMTRCHEEGGCMQKKSKCVTHNLWDGLSKAIYGYLRSISLGEVCRSELDKKTMFLKEEREFHA